MSLSPDELYWLPTDSGIIEPRYDALMEIAISDEALDVVREKGGTAAVDYIHAIG